MESCAATSSSSINQVQTGSSSRSLIKCMWVPRVCEYVATDYVDCLSIRMFCDCGFAIVCVLTLSLLRLLLAIQSCSQIALIILIPPHCFFAFVIVRQIYTPHYNLESNQISSTRTSSLDWIVISKSVKFAYVSITIRLYFEKWINSYFCGTNFMSNFLAQVINRACTLLILLQFF